MPPEQRDAALLWDMLQAAQSVRDFVLGVGYPEYQRNRMMQLAVERAVEIIGEAAKNVSPTLKQAQPQIPWQGMIAQRNVLAHEYGDIKLDKMWIVATRHIPALIDLLKPLIPTPPLM